MNYMKNLFNFLTTNLNKKYKKARSLKHLFNLLPTKINKSRNQSAPPPYMYIISISLGTFARFIHKFKQNNCYVAV